MEESKKKRTGHAAPEGYDAGNYEKPSVACDVVILTFRDGDLEIVLIRRSRDPYEGYWALPGGFVDIDESLEAAAAREVREETGVTGLGLIGLGAFGDPDRDPRTRVISSAYMALVRPGDIKPRAGDDAAEAEWHGLGNLPDLAFDHEDIIAKAMERLREMAVLSPRLFELLPERFGLAQYKALCERVMARRYEDDGFYGSIRRNPHFIRTGAGDDGEELFGFDASAYRDGEFMFLLLG